MYFYEVILKIWILRKNLISNVIYRIHAPFIFRTHEILHFSEADKLIRKSILGMFNKKSKILRKFSSRTAASADFQNEIAFHRIRRPIYFGFNNFVNSPVHKRKQHPNLFSTHKLNIRPQLEPPLIKPLSKTYKKIHSIRLTMKATTSIDALKKLESIAKIEDTPKSYNPTNRPLFYTGLTREPENVTGLTIASSQSLTVRQIVSTTHTSGYKSDTSTSCQYFDIHSIMLSIKSIEYFVSDRRYDARAQTKFD